MMKTTAWCVWFFFFGPFWTLSHWFLCFPLFDCYFAVCRRQTLEGAATHYTSFPTLHEGLARSWGCYELIKQFCSFTNAVWNTIKLFIEAIVKFKTHHYLKHDKKNHKLQQFPVFMPDTAALLPIYPSFCHVPFKIKVLTMIEIWRLN